MASSSMVEHLALTQGVGGSSPPSPARRIDMSRWRNKKNGHIYVVVMSVINCTNAQDGQLMIVYKREDSDDLVFCREMKEFYNKFESVDD